MNFIIVEVKVAYMVRPRQRPRQRCPACGGQLVNVQGLPDCKDCQWAEGQTPGER